MGHIHHNTVARTVAATQSSRNSTTRTSTVEKFKYDSACNCYYRVYTGAIPSRYTETKEPVSSEVYAFYFIFFIILSILVLGISSALSKSE